VSNEIVLREISMPDAVRRPAITERALRPIALLENHNAQQAAYSMLLDP
jgi:hypothetical protein